MCFVTMWMRVSSKYEIGNVRITYHSGDHCCSGQAVLHSLSVCSLSYAAYNAHAPYCRMWPAPLYGLFTHYLINGMILERKKITGHKMCVLIFSTTFV